MSFIADNMPSLGTLSKIEICPNCHLGFGAQRGHKCGMATNNIAQIRRSAGLTQTQLAQAIGTTLNNLGKLERGDRRLNQDWINKIASACGVGPDAVLVAKEEGEPEVPVVGFVGAGGEIVFEDAYERGGSLYEIGLLPGMSSNGLIGLEVRGDSMYPAIRDGHVAFFRRDGWDHVEEEALREWAVCRLKDGRTLLKEVRRSAVPNRYDLISVNAPPIEAVELEWATPVVGWRRR